jgi:hypothetical protein
MGFSSFGVCLKMGPVGSQDNALVENYKIVLFFLRGRGDINNLGAGTVIPSSWNPISLTGQSSIWYKI